MTWNAFQSITKAYGRIDPDGSRYLLGDHTGLLSLLVITHEKEKYVMIHFPVFILVYQICYSVSYVDMLIKIMICLYLNF